MNLLISRDRIYIQLGDIVFSSLDERLRCTVVMRACTRINVYTIIMYAFTIDCTIVYANMARKTKFGAKNEQSTTVANSKTLHFCDLMQN